MSAIHEIPPSPKSPRLKDRSSDIPLYIRTHTDPFSEPFTESELDLRQSLSKITHGKTTSGTASQPDLSNHLVDSTESVDSTASSKRCGKICRCFRKTKANLEPRESWLLLFFGILPVNILFGINTITFGLYYVEYVEYFQVNRSTAGIIIAIKTGIFSVGGILGSTLIKRLSPRKVSMIGAALVCGGVFLGSFAPNIYVLYVTKGIIEGCGASILVLNSSVLIQRHFTKNRALGGGIGMLGYSFGHLIGPILVNFLISTYGWRGATLITSAIYGNILAITATYWQPKEKQIFVEKDVQNIVENQVENGDIEETMSDDLSQTSKQKRHNVCKDICKDIFNFRYFKVAKFTLSCIAASFARYNIKTFLEHGPNKVVSLGMTRTDGAMIISIFSTAAICTRTLTTFLANIKGVNRIIYYSAGVLVGSGASFVTMVHTFRGQAVAAVMHGMHTGFTNTIQSVLIVDLMGVDHLAKCIALFNLVISAISLFAAPFGGYLYDVTHNYDIPYIVSGVLGFIGGMLMFAVGISYHRNKRRQKHDHQENIEMPENDIVSDSPSATISTDVQILSKDLLANKLTSAESQELLKPLNNGIGKQQQIIKT